MEEKFKIFGTYDAGINSKNNFGSTKLEDLPLTMVYAPMQPYSETYKEEEALIKGTFFPSLDKPFKGARR